MASILKVDTLQKPDGSTPTAADLGIDDTPKVIFHATNNAGISGDTSSWVKHGSTLIVRHDTHNGWDNTNYRWIVPKTARYHILLNHLSYGNVNGAVYVNGAQIVGNGQTHSRQGETGYNATSGINNVCNLTEGDVVEYYAYIASGGYAYADPYFGWTITEIV